MPLTPSGIEPATFRLVAQGLNQLRHRVPFSEAKSVLVSSKVSGPVDVAGRLCARVVTVSGPVDVAGPLCARVVTVSGPVDVAGPLCARVVTVSGPVDVAGPLCARVASDVIKITFERIWSSASQESGDRPVHKGAFCL